MKSAVVRNVEIGLDGGLYSRLRASEPTFCTFHGCSLRSRRSTLLQCSRPPHRLPLQQPKQRPWQPLKMNRQSCRPLLVWRPPLLPRPSADRVALHVRLGAVQEQSMRTDTTDVKMHTLEGRVEKKWTRLEREREKLTSCLILCWSSNDTSMKLQHTRESVSKASVSFECVFAHRKGCQKSMGS